MIPFLIVLFQRISPLLFVRIVLVLMFFIPGILAIYVGITGSQWFFSSRSPQYIRETIGPMWTRLLYVILGALLIGCGVIGIYDPANLMPQQ